MTPRLPSQIVTITPVSPPAPGHRFLMGEEPPTATREIRWLAKNRTRRKDATEYDGVSPYSLTLPLVLSYLDIDRSIEDLILRAEMAFGPPNERPGAEPPVVKIECPGYPPLVRWLRWVMVGIDPGEEARNDDGTRSLAFFTMRFMEYVPVSLVLQANLSPSQAAARRASDRGDGAAPGVNADGSSSSTPDDPSIVVPGDPGPTAVAGSSHTYTVKPDDTLVKIAAQQLGSAARWHDIADLNHIASDEDLAPGLVLRIPGRIRDGESHTRFGPV